MKRCEWAGTETGMVEYHDKVWGVPVHDDRLLFEFLILEGAQAGLSWSTIVGRFDSYREAFDGFDVEKVARYNKRKRESLLKNPGIIRNRLKVESAVRNAKAFIKVQDEFGSFDSYVWGFVGGKPIQNRWKSMKEIPAETQVAHSLSKDLKKRGFNFVGPTICYAFMQAMGMVNDHVPQCFRYQQVKKLAR